MLESISSNLVGISFKAYGQKIKRCNANVQTVTLSKLPRILYFSYISLYLSTLSKLPRII